MSFSIPKFNLDLPMFCHCQKYFSVDEMDQISFLEDLQHFEKGKIGESNNTDKNTLDNIRNSDISWLNPDNHNQWLFQRFSWLTSKINHEYFMLDIDGIENFQYTIYKKSQFYTWHIDNHLNYRKFDRKISAIIMLSDPSEYEGGELEIVVDGNIEKPRKVEMEKGDVVFFASWMPHRVAPVTSGKRKTLVAWVMGNRNG